MGGGMILPDKLITFVLLKCG